MFDLCLFFFSLKGGNGEHVGSRKKRWCAYELRIPPFWGFHTLHSLRGYFVRPVAQAEGNGYKILVLLPIPLY